MTADDLMPYILGYTAAFIAGVFITRAIFSIPKLLKFQEAQVQILTEIAKNQGVKVEVIAKIYDETGLYGRAKTNEEIREELDEQAKKRNID